MAGEKFLQNKKNETQICQMHTQKLWRYFVLFARYSDLFIENCEIFIPHLYLVPPQGVTPSEFCKDV